MATLILNHLLDFSGALSLGDEFELSEGSRKETHFYDHNIEDWVKQVTVYSRKFVIQITETKPKKVSRKCEFFVDPDRKADSFLLIYIKDNQCLWKEPAPVTESADGDFVFNLTDFLRSKQIEYVIPEYRKRSSYDRLRMMNGATPKPYGASYYLSSGGIAWDGTGTGYIHYLTPGYLTYRGTGINKLHINSYALKSISDKVNEVLEKCPRELSTEEIRQLLGVMCSGNEIGIATDNLDIFISRHYSSGIKVTAFGRKETFNLPHRDRKHSIRPDVDLLEKVENQYAVMLQKLIGGRSYDEVEQIIRTGLAEIENL